MPHAQLETGSPVRLNAEQIYQPVQSDLLRVEESLKAIVPPETALLASSISHSMQSKGKLLRPLLTLLAAGASGNIKDAHIETAAVAELIHVATLLHDDVLDESDIRRGIPTVKAQWGNKLSILSGDYLLAQASLKLSYLNQCRLVTIFAIVLANLCEGEVEQICSSFQLEATWDSYFKKSVCKTASLFAACCEAAGVVNQLPETEIQQLRLFGEKFGIGFQIVDDLLDYTGSAQQLGKPAFDDLQNGLLNAPILLALEAFPAGSTKRKELTALIDTLFSDDTPSERLEGVQQELNQLLDDAGVIQKTQDLAETYMEEARQALSFLPETHYRKALFDLSRYATQRNH